MSVREAVSKQLLAIEINDAGLLTCHESNTTPPPPSPGYAVLDGDRLLTGSEAFGRARLEPRRTNNRFWSELNTSPLGRPFPSEVSHADLAHAHLSHVWSRAGGNARGILLAVPGSSSEDQLGLTLGIARACEMPVSGLVDSAVAAAAGTAGTSRVLHLDLQLHRAVLTEIRQENEAVRGPVHVSPHTGLAALYTAWMRGVAEAFVKQTRFDPLHSADTEQSLFQRIPVLLEHLRRDDRAILQIDASGTVVSVEVTRSSLVTAAASGLEAMVHLVRTHKRFGEPTTILLSSRAALLPGLLERIREVGDAEVRELPADAPLSGALRNRRSIVCPDGDALPFITRLPCAAPRPEPAPPLPSPPRVSTPAPRVEGLPPTHVLHGGLAYRITDSPLHLGTAIPDGARGIDLSGDIAGVSRTHCVIHSSDAGVVIEDRSTHGTFVNDQRVEGTARLAAGDRLRLGSAAVEIQIIALVEDDGPA